MQKLPKFYLIGFLALSLVVSFIEKLEAQTPLPSPWQSQNIGASPIPGKASFSDGTFTISGSGKQRVSGEEDSFHFVYQKVSGDCTITIQITSVTEQPVTHYDTQGLMFRASLDKNSAMFTMANCTYKTNVLVREETGSYAPDLCENGIEQQAPIWLRITRKGSNYTGFYSADGKTWTAQKSATVSLPKELYVGMCVSSNADDQACTATFNNWTIVRDDDLPKAVKPDITVNPKK